MNETIEIGLTFIFIVLITISVPFLVGVMMYAPDILLWFADVPFFGVLVSWIITTTGVMEYEILLAKHLLCFVLTMYVINLTLFLGFIMLDIISQIKFLYAKFIGCFK